MRDALPRIEAFLDVLAQNAEMLNDVQLRLAHKDLHFGNILYDSDSSKITAAIDWEFASIVLFTQRNPVKAFLSSPPFTKEFEKETEALTFLDRCSRRSVHIARDAEFTSPEQEAMQKAANFLRAIVEVSPRE